MLRILKQTYYHGKAYNVGAEYDIDSATEKRWIMNGIAEAVPSMNCPPVQLEESDIDIGKSSTRGVKRSKVIQDE